MTLRHLVVVLGDHLDERSAAFDGFDPALDAIWMAECVDEANHAWSHRARTAVFLGAMRHFAAHLRDRGWTVHYRVLGEHPHASLKAALHADIGTLRPQRVVMLECGEWRLQADFAALAQETAMPFEVRPDRHFLCSRTDFGEWVSARGAPRMEVFYRWMRERTGWLMQDGAPVGGRWNFDAENRGHFGPLGPGFLPAVPSFAPDAITREVLETVQRHFPEHPGSLALFDWPVTRAQALESMRDFIEHRLPVFGAFQDAMWTGAPTLWHSRLSSSLNLKLLDPREVCEAALGAFAKGHAPIEAVEGFVRQILGWREFVRGIYWQRMPGYLELNALDAQEELPWFYWTGDTPMNCLRQAIGETLAHGYAHHIQRLMVTGLFALLLGVKPRAVHAWYLAVYVDAVEWVELPNTLGMSQYGDGGIVGSKPYVASGRYIDRMSDYCRGCRFDPALAIGEKACPFTTLYWDFLDRHRSRFGEHERLRMQVRNLDRKSPDERQEIALQATAIREGLRADGVRPK